LTINNIHDVSRIDSINVMSCRSLLEISRNSLGLLMALKDFFFKWYLSHSNVANEELRFLYKWLKW
jgi:hypothetical protein